PYQGGVRGGQPPLDCRTASSEAQRLRPPGSNWTVSMTRIYNRATEKETRRRLRRDAPNAEHHVCSRLRARQLAGLKFRRQYGVGPFVLDFYCPALKLAVEIDGDSHFEEGAAARDRERQVRLEQYGIRFLRVTNLDVFENLDGVMERIGTIVEQ